MFSLQEEVSSLQEAVSSLRDIRDKIYLAVTSAGIRQCDTGVTPASADIIVFRTFHQNSINRGKLGQK